MWQVMLGTAVMLLTITFSVAKAPPFGFKELGTLIKEPRGSGGEAARSCLLFSKVANGNFGSIGSCAMGEGACLVVDVQLEGGG